MRPAFVLTVALAIVPGVLADGVSLGGGYANVAGQHVEFPVVTADVCVEKGTLRPGDRAEGDTRVAVQDHEARDGYYSGRDDVYRVELAAPATVQATLEQPWDNPFVAGSPDSGWGGMMYLRTACPDPASEVATSGRYEWAGVYGGPGRSDLWRALPAGTYWLVVDGEWGGAEGPYRVALDTIDTPAPSFATSLGKHAHPGEWTTFGARGVNRDTTFRIAGQVVAARGVTDSAEGCVPTYTYCSTAGQQVSLRIPDGLADGNYTVEMSNGDTTAARCCLAIVPHVHPPQPRLRFAIVGADPPANGEAYRHDEDIRVHVAVRNEGDAAGRPLCVCMFAMNSVGGWWIDADVERPTVEPGSTVVVPATFRLSGEVGDILVRATNGAPQLLGAGPVVADSPDEIVVHVLVDGHGAGL